MTVYLSGSSTFVMRFQPSRPTSLLAGLSTALVEKTTSSALNGAPSDQRTPLRRCQVIVFPSGLMPPLDWVGTTVTSSGYGRLSESYFTRYACVSSEMYPMVVSVNRCGLSVGTSPVPSAIVSECVGAPGAVPAFVHEQSIPTAA